MKTPKIHLLLEAKEMLGAWQRHFPAHAIPSMFPKRGEFGSKTGCQRQVVVLPGYGKRDYPFPSVDELVARAIAYFIELSQQYEKMGARLEIGEPEEAEESDVLNVRSGGRASRKSLGVGAVGRVRTKFCICADMADGVVGKARSGKGKRKPNDTAPATPAATADKAESSAASDAGEAPGNVLRIAVGTLAHIMEMGRDEAALARTFDPLRGRVNWALYHMPAHLHPEKYKDTAESLRDQLDKLIDVERQAVPRMKQFLKAQFPRASEEEILDAAISLLNEQLRDILTVLSIWTEAFAQLSDGLYPQLAYLQFMLAQSLRLFQTGDAGTGLQPGIKTEAFHLDDLFMARYSDQGPAAIPGSRGPVGAHMIMTPMYERRISIIDLPIYGHEFFHLFYFDAKGLADEKTAVVLKAIQDDGSKGRYKFQSEYQMLGKQKVPTLQLMIQLFGQTLSEMTADVVGGVSLTGEAYAYSVLSVFGAFNIGSDSAILANWLLSSSSIYGIGPNAELVFEEHLPDIVRILAIAAVLENRGFPKEAREIEKLAEQSAGVPMPEYVTWRNFNPNSPFKFEIKLAISDLKQVMATVIETILDAKLNALNGASLSDLVNWTCKRQEKVNALVANLLKGSSEIPWEMGDFFAPYVAAAANKALWTLWKSGTMPPLMATDFIELHARKMMDQLRERFEQAEKVPLAQPVVPGEPGGDAAAESAATAGGANADDDQSLSAAGDEEDEVSEAEGDAADKLAGSPR